MTGMSDAAWRLWLSALADPAIPLTVTLCGIYRQTGWDMGRRRLDDHMLHLIHEGGQVGTVAGRPVRTVPGDLLWVPAGVEQVLRQRPDRRWFGKRNLRFALAAEPPPLPAVIPGAAVLGDQLDTLRRTWTARQADRGARLRAQLVLLFADLRTLSARAAGGLPPEAQEHLLTLVEREPADRPQPAELARALGLSPTWFARLFRRTYGCAPRAWLVRHRIARAAERLQTACSIGTVAAEFGYDDLFLFSRQFRAVMGQSPRRWLAAHRP
jgi:AraC-like DNA-binding protein